MPAHRLSRGFLGASLITVLVASEYTSRSPRRYSFAQNGQMILRKPLNTIGCSPLLVASAFPLYFFRFDDYTFSTEKRLEVASLPTSRSGLKLCIRPGIIGGGF